MSTGADCVFEEREPGRWWYRIQRWPYGESEEYDEHGPFTARGAREHLDSNYGNPGGYRTVDHENWKARLAERAAREAQRADEDTKRIGAPRRRPR